MSLPEGKNKNHVQSKPQQNKIPTNNRNTSKCWSKPLFLSLLQKHTQSASCTPKLQSSIAFQNMSGFSCRLLATAPWLLWEQASLWRAKAGRWSRWRINKYFFFNKYQTYHSICQWWYMSWDFDKRLYRNRDGMTQKGKTHGFREGVRSTLCFSGGCCHTASLAQLLLSLQLISARKALTQPELTRQPLCKS